MLGVFISYFFITYANMDVDINGAGHNVYAYCDCGSPINRQWRFFGCMKVTECSLAIWALNMAVVFSTNNVKNPHSI